MQLGVSEVLEGAEKVKYRADKINYLRLNGNLKPFVVVLQYALHPDIKWVLPKGQFPYRKNELPGQESALLSEARRLYLFVETKEHPNTLPQNKRETLFVQLLEMLHEKDANLLQFIKDNKKLPYESLDYDLVAEAFPGIIPTKVEAPVLVEEAPKIKVVKSKKPKKEKVVLSKKPTEVKKTTTKKGKGKKA